MMILKPVQFLYHSVSSAKNFLFEKNILKKVELPVPVISVGNLTFGGSGKTPHIEFLAKELSLKYKVAIVCRSYKASLAEPKKVDLNQQNSTAVFGDEACMLQAKLPQCFVWSGPLKSQTAKAALSDQPDLILVDDGFSHFALKRNFDLLLFPSDFTLSTFTRESFKSIQRANAVIITKENLVGSENVQAIKDLILKEAPHLKNAIYTSKTSCRLDIDEKSEIFAFCALAKPEDFFSSLSKVVFKEIFSDHHQYTEDDQISLYNKYNELKKTYPNLQIITTEKDFVKIKNEKLKSVLRIAVLKLEMSEKNQEGLLGQIRSII